MPDVSMPRSTSYNPIPTSAKNESLTEKVYSLRELLDSVDYQVDCINGGLTGRLVSKDGCVPSADGIIPVLDYCLELAQDLKYKAGIIKETISGS